MQKIKPGKKKTNKRDQDICSSVYDCKPTPRASHKKRFHYILKASLKTLTNQPGLHHNTAVSPVKLWLRNSGFLYPKFSTLTKAWRPFFHHPRLTTGETNPNQEIAKQPKNWKHNPKSTRTETSDGGSEAKSYFLLFSYRLTFLFSAFTNRSRRETTSSVVGCLLISSFRGGLGSNPTNPRSFSTFLGTIRILF